MTAPRILIPMRRDLRRDLPIQFAHQAHLDALIQVGAVPVPLPALRPVAGLLEIYLEEADGLLLAEGGDIQTSSVDPSSAQELKEVDPEKDELELALADHAVRNDLPTLATCRGAQVINVAMGGTLHTHLPRDLGDHVRHVDVDNYDGLRHPLSIRPGSPLHEIYGEETISATSVHHQGVAGLADGLVADAYSPDGLIEGFHSPSHTFLVCVQHHPERQLDEHPGHLGLYKALSDAARDRNRRA